MVSLCVILTPQLKAPQSIISPTQLSEIVVAMGFHYLNGVELMLWVRGVTLAYVKIPSTGLGILLQVQGRLQWEPIPQRWFIFFILITFDV